MSELISRLKQRKLVQWALAYLAAGWALLQALGLAADSYDWPHGVMRIAFAVIALGFVVTLALAWYHGERGAQRVSGTEIVILALLLAIGGGLLWRFARVTQTAGAASVANDAVDSANSATGSFANIPAKSIAVLPFENLSEDKGNAYFADGMQDLILTKLADIGDLKVISRTSTEKYQSHPDNLKTIAQQLGVATILEGSVQKAGNEVLINVQLIDAHRDNHLWAESYTRTRDNIFGVEGEVAQKVADALKVKLSGGEQKTLAAVPTRNPAAWDAFLKAETLSQKGRDSESGADFADAEANYRHAIALDPEFALAYANLAYTQMVDCWFGSHSAALIPEAKAAADRAMALAPDLPEARVALGFYYYWGFFNYDAAIEEFQQALKISPTNLEARKGLAFVWRRQGKFEQALAAFRQMLAVSPRDRVLLDEYGDTYMKLRRYPEAKEQLQQALAIDPDYVDAKDVLVQVLLFGFGDVAGARAVVTPPPAWRTTGSSVGELFDVIDVRAYPDLFDRKFDAALHDFDSAPTTTPEQRIFRDAARAAIAVVAGRQASMQADCRRIKPLLDAEVAKIGGSDQVTNPAALAQLSWVDACLGQNADAIAAARRGVNLVPLSKDVYSGQWFLTGLAQIEAHAGAPGDAVKLLEELMAMPAGDSVSVKRLELDPVWDPLRSDPRFQALLQKYSGAQPATSASGASP
ncbi:MAG: tetratricopeptide repeat protein [Rhodanobacteraceae bacterium]|nr:MAG: tetratricopeptide repeat protein [Rhodanobacteraceae bacterium]